MSITLLTIYIMLWTLGICASYAFVMTATKKDASLSFLRRASLVALLSYGVAWFFGVLYYIQPDTIARFAKTAAPSTNAALYAFFAQARECIFLSFIAIPILAGLLGVLVFRTPEIKSHMVFASVALTIFGTIAIFLAMMIA